MRWVRPRGSEAVRDAALDAVVVLVAAGYGLEVIGLRAPQAVEPYGGATVALLTVVALSLVFRRRAPIAVAWISVAATAVLMVVDVLAPAGLFRRDLGLDELDAIVWFPPYAPFAAYGAMAFAANRRAAWVPVTALVLLVIVMTPPWYSDEVGDRSLSLVAGAALLGMYVTTRRRLVHELTERAERAEREQYLLAEQARGDERTRLAAEIHDVVTHRVSLMVLQSGALRVTTTDEPTRHAAEELRATGCRALEELRDLVGILRDSTGGGDDVAPMDPHGVPLPDLSSLLTESESAGAPVELVAEGDPGLVAPVVASTVYRVVQEALTNVRKHAPGSLARVRVRYRTDRVHLSIRNTAPSGATDTALVAAGTGTGLLGLRQRVELIDGTMRAGPDSGGGFVVEATLPAYVSTSKSPEPAR